MRVLVLLIAGCLRLGVLAALIGCDLKPASAAEITLSDLDHAQIDTIVLVDRHVQENGQPPSSDRISNNWHLSVDGTSIHADFAWSMMRPDGPHPGRGSHGTFTIGKPKGVRYLGSGEAVWIFEGGKLVSLRTYREGAFKTVISFSRSSNGLTCSVHAAFAREGGVGAIEFQTAGRGQDIKVLSAKVASTSCHVHTR
jgi:hypothetical protein